jgi:hypothetical protein
MRLILGFTALSIMLISCARELPEDTTAVLETSDMSVYYGCDEINSSYFNEGDSASQIQSLINDLRNDFDDKGDDLEIVSANARFKIALVYVRLTESLVETSVDDPCGTGSITYTLSDLNGSIRIAVTDNYTGARQEIYAESSTTEEVKGKPTIFQSMFGNDSCYTPSVRRAYPETMKNRLLRRAYRKTMNAMQSMMR